MRSQFLSACLVLCTAVSIVCQNTEPLGDVARRLRREKENKLKTGKSAAGSETTARPIASAEPSPRRPDTASSSTGIDALDAAGYLAHVQKLLANEQFGELERIAANARSNKSRFPGGGWKLYTFYQPFCASKCQRGGSDVGTSIERLRRWIAAKPDSITARVALASAYLSYAWDARGEDYADLVDDEAWGAFRDRLQLARETLEKASALKEKCPHWYYIMQQVARAESRSLRELNAIADEASSAEPLYYYIYKEHAFALQPRWHGEEGDSERYAEQVADRIGGKQGDATYFEIAATLYCVGCSESKAAFARISWPRIQEGYAALEELYGSSYYKLNQFAHLALRAEDQPVALKLFMRIGDNYDKTVWHSRRYFESSRTWATNPPPALLADWQSATANMQSPEGTGYFHRVSMDFNKNSLSVAKDCMRIVEGDTGSFNIFVKVDESGRAEKMSAWPPTRLSTCVVPKLQKYAFALPPRPSYWIMLGVVPKPALIRMQGAPLPESGI